MSRFNIAINQGYVAMATPRIANERRVRRPIAAAGANDRYQR